MEAWRRELRHNLLMHSFLCHYAKGQTARKHKYVAIRDGRYIYPEDLVNQKNSSGMGSRDPRYQRQGNGMEGDPRYAKPKSVSGSENIQVNDAKPKITEKKPNVNFDAQKAAMDLGRKFANEKIKDLAEKRGAKTDKINYETPELRESKNIDRKTRQDLYKVGSQMKGASSEQVEKKASDIADQTGYDANDIFNVLWAVSRLTKGDVLGAKRIMDRNKARVANSQQPYKRGGYR